MHFYGHRPSDTNVAQSGWADGKMGKHTLTSRFTSKSFQYGRAKAGWPE